MIDDAALGWTAGILEGEGSVRIDRPNARQRAALYVSVTSTDAEIVAFFQERWPGYIKRVSGTGVGRRRQAWAWVVAARKAAAFLAEIEPYLRTARMREKVALGLEFQAQKQLPGTRDRAHRQRQVDYYNRMAVLNHRGTGPLPEPFDGAGYVDPDRVAWRERTDAKRKAGDG